MTDVLERTTATTPPVSAPPTTAPAPAQPGRRSPDRLKDRGSGPSPRSFRPDVEGLRAIAVVSVVLYHAGLGIRGGFIGVDVFFVISGFLITRQLMASVGSIGIRALPTFYTRRIKRLLPASTVVVVATIVAARIWAPALLVKSITLDGLFTTFYGLNYRLANEGTQYQHATDTVSPLQHFWSLGVEEQFYVVWPVLILLTSWIGRRHKRGLLTAALLGLIGVTFWFSVTVTAHNTSLAYFSLHTRAWELGLGALVAVSAQRLARMPRLLGEWGARLGLVAVLTSAFLYSNVTPYPGSAAALPVVGTALVIACGCGPRRRVERILGEPLMQCLGRISYAWYLWHFPMLTIAPYVVGHALDWRARLLVVWASLAIALLSFFLIENPVRHLGRKAWTGFAAGLALTATVVAAVTVIMSHLPSTVGHGKAVAALQQATGAGSAELMQVQREISAGLQTVAAPSNLTPTPQKAAADLPPSSSDGCHADFLSIKQGTCVFGDPAGTHTAVLFGDSHMEQWLPAFDAAAKQRHWKIVNWTKAACPPAQLSVFAPSLHRQYTECDTWRAITLARITALKPNLVFVSQSENVASSSVTPQQYTSATIATMTTLRQQSGAKVEFLQDIPVPDYDMPTCIADHLSNVQSCTFPMSKAYAYPRRHAAMAPAIKGAGFTVDETAQWLCTSQRCPAIVGNVIAYRNDTHMTRSYSTWLAPMVAPLLTVN